MDINKKVDDLLLSKGLKEYQKQKFWNHILAVGDFLIAFLLISVAFIPFFDKQLSFGVNAEEPLSSGNNGAFSGLEFDFDPIFGDDSTSYSQEFDMSEHQFALEINPDTDCTVDNISVYLKNGHFSTAAKVTCHIYTDSGGLVTNGKTDELSIAGDGVGASYSWRTFTYSGTKPTLSSGNTYFLCVFDDGGGTLTLSYQASGDGAIHYEQKTGNYNTFDSNWLSGEYTEDTTAEASMYCSYTASGGGYTNTAPTFSGNQPVGSGQDLTPMMNVTVNDANGNSTTVDWYYNDTIGSGSWTHLITNSSHTANTSCQQEATFATDYNSDWNIKVTANDTHDNSSIVWSFTTKDVTPTAPVLTDATEQGFDEIQISWTDDANADTTYIEAHTVNDSTWARGEHTTITPINSSSSPQSFTGLTEDTTYYFKAWSYNETQPAWGAGSDRIDETTAPPLDVDTSITITDYIQTSSPLSITATPDTPADVDNVSLYYRYSPSNESWYNDSIGYISENIGIYSDYEESFYDIPWKTTIDGCDEYQESSVLYEDGVLYVRSDNNSDGNNGATNKLYAINSMNGSIIWSSSLEDGGYGGMFLDDTYVYIPIFDHQHDGNGGVECHYKSNGTQKWYTSILGGVSESLPHNDTHIFAFNASMAIGDDDGRLNVINKDTGAVDDTYQTNHYSCAGVHLLIDDLLYASVAYADGSAEFICINTSILSETWSITIDDAWDLKMLRGYNDSAIFFQDNSHIYSINRNNNGAEFWNMTPFDPQVDSRIVYSDGLIFSANADNSNNLVHLYAIYANNGTIKWDVNVTDTVDYPRIFGGNSAVNTHVQAPAVGDDTVILPLSNTRFGKGVLVGCNISTGDIESMHVLSTDLTMSPIVVDGFMYLVEQADSNDDNAKLTCLKVGSGSRTNAVVYDGDENNTGSYVDDFNSHYKIDVSFENVGSDVFVWNVTNNYPYFVRNITLEHVNVTGYNINSDWYNYSSNQLLKDDSTTYTFDMKAGQTRSIKMINNSGDTSASDESYTPSDYLKEYTLVSTDTSSPYSWDFSFPESYGYYEFYSRGENGTYIEDMKYLSDDMVHYTDDSWSNTAPTVENEYPSDGATGISISPDMHVTVNDSDGNASTVYWKIDTDSNVNDTTMTTHQNTSITNDTAYYNITGLDYNTEYFVGVWANDTHDNTSKYWSFTTDADAPVIIINFAGNLSDSGGPYWRPPGESTQLSGVWSDGYYTNASCQHEDWIYINCTITNASTVYLQWLNETSWTNDTYTLMNTAGDYWEINTSGTIQTCEGYNYSFDIKAVGYGGTTIERWEKNVFVDQWTTKLTRRYVQLSSTETNISYKPYYFYTDDIPTQSSTFTYDSSDLLEHDQGAYGTHDCGYLESDINDDTTQNVYCGRWLNFYFNDEVGIEPINIENIYYHFWWDSDDNDLEGVGWNRNRDEGFYERLDEFSVDINDEVSSIDYSSSRYSLSTKLLSLSSENRDFTDNSIYEFNLVFEAYNNDFRNPSVVSNRSYTSFVLFNVPTENSGDSDSDGLNDTTELYTTYTNPFVNDTDNDGVNDYNENSWGSDPNNYTDTASDSTPEPPTGFTATKYERFQINLSWTNATKSDKVYIEYKTDSNDSDWNIGDQTPIDADGYIESNTYDHTGLTEGTTYYYAIWSHNNTQGVNSTSASFDSATTDSNNAPTADTPSPADNSGEQSNSVTLSVTVHDTDGDSVDVEFHNSTDDSIIGTHNDVVNGGTASTTWSGLAYDSNNEWYVTVSDDYDTTNQSGTVWNFTVMSEPPLSVSSPFPANNSQTVLTGIGNMSVIIDSAGEWNISLYENNSDGSLGSLVAFSNGSSSSGVQYCDVSDALYYMFDKNFTWYVNATDGSTWSNNTYYFTTFNGSGFLEIDNISNSTSWYYHDNIFVRDDYVFSNVDDYGLYVYSYKNESFVFIDNHTGDYGDCGIHGNSSYVFATAITSDGINAYTFDGETLTLVNRTKTSYSYIDVYATEEYVFFANRTTDDAKKIEAYVFDGTDFVFKDSWTLSGSEAIGDVKASSNNMIYVTKRNAGIFAKQFNTTSEQFEGSVYSQDDGDGYYNIAIGDEYIYIAASTGGIFVYSFDDGFTLEYEANHDNYRSVWVEGDNVFVGTGGNGLYSYIFEGGSLIEQDSYHTDGNYWYTNLYYSDGYLFSHNFTDVMAYGYELLRVAPPVIDVRIAGDPSKSSVTRDGVIRYVNQSYNPQSFCNITANITVPDYRTMGRYFQTTDDDILIPSGNLSDGDTDYVHEQNHSLIASQWECTYTGEYSQISGYLIGSGMSPPWVSYAIYTDNNGEPGTLLGFTERDWPGSDTFTETERDMGTLYYPPCTRIWHTGDIAYDGSGASTNSITLTEGNDYWLVMATNDSKGYTSYGYTYSNDIYWLLGNDLGDTCYVKMAPFNLSDDMNFSNATGLSWSNAQGQNGEDVHYACIYAIANNTYNDVPTVDISSATVHWYDDGSNTVNHSMTEMANGQWTYNKTGLTSGNWYSFDITGYDELNDEVTYEHFRWLVEGNTERIEFQCGVSTVDETNHQGYNSSSTLYRNESVLYLWNRTYGTDTWYGDDEHMENALPHEQGVDGTPDDTGGWEATLPDGTMQARHCLKFAGAWWDENISIDDTITLNDVYVHWWTGGGVDYDTMRIHYGWMSTLYDFGWLDLTSEVGVDWNYLELNTNTSTVTSIVENNIPATSSDPSGIDNTLRLLAEHINLSGNLSSDYITLDSSSIYNFFIGYDNNGSLAWSKESALIVNNRSYPSFILFNIPEDIKDGTNNTDSDGDGLSDHEELYDYYTHPFLFDTDGDSVNDSADSYPNDYTRYTFVVDNPVPANNSNQDINTLTELTIDITGDGSYNWRIEWNGDSNSSTDDSSGTKDLQINTSNLTEGVTYTWYVNVTDGTNTVNNSYSFTVEGWQTISNTIGNGTLGNSTQWQTITNTVGDGTLGNTTSWTTISSTIGDGTLSNTTSWQTISNTIGNGTLSHISSWTTISDTIGDGILSRITTWQTISNTIGNGTLSNTTSWKTISSTIGDGTLANTTSWKTVSNTIGDGTLSHSSTWQTVSDTVGDGFLSNSTQWQTITNTVGDGSISHSTSWQTISSTIGDGTVSHSSSWQTISDTIGDGTLSHLNTWQIISSAIGDGILQNSTSWKNISSNIGEGTLSNTTSWTTISDTIGDGSISNTTHWTTISDTIGDGTLSHTLTWQTITDTLGDGTLGNATTWKTISSTTGNGTLTNTTSWTTISNTLGDGSITNITSWKVISSTIGDGTLSNTTIKIWRTISSTTGDGTLSNTTNWQTISNTIGDGTISNATSWQTISDTTGDGTLSHTLSWNTLSSTIGYGTLSNTTTWKTVTSSIGDGTLSNTTNWQTVSNTIGDGTLANITINTWQTISNTIGNGTLSNTTNWQTISNTIGDGTLSNTTSWKNISTTIGDGTLENTTVDTWQTISDTLGDGSLSNTTIWTTISNTIGDGTLSNTTSWTTISDTIGDGTLSHTLTWQTISDIVGDGTLSNTTITTWQTITNTIGEGTLSNTTSWQTISNTIGDGALSHISSWNTISNTIGDGTLSNSTSWTTISDTIGDGTLQNISTKPILSNPNPANNSIITPTDPTNITQTWNITITDNTNSFNYTITCNNGQNTSDNETTNGSKTISLTNLNIDTTYTIYVNATRNNTDSHTNETFYFTIAEGNMTGNYDYTVEGQTIILTPQLQPGVTNYKWKIEDENGNQLSTTEWINYSDSQTHTSILEFNKTYIVYLFIKNSTLQKEIGKTISTISINGTEGDKDDFRDYTTTEEKENKTTTPRYKNLFDNVPVPIKNFFGNPIIQILTAIAVITLFLTFLRKKPKKYLYIRQKKNE